MNYESFRRNDGVRGPWYEQRPRIAPTTLVVHTNAASGEGSTSSQVNWANGGANNTHAHYNVNEPQPTKHCPTDRRGIGNSTGDDLQRRDGVQDSSFWSIVIETADMGSDEARRRGIDWPADCGPFLHDHAELVARILAYESVVWQIPLEYPSTWTRPGTLCHTDPFPFPHFTTVRGKTCPGSTKMRQVREDILPRAREIRAAWRNEPTPPPSPTDATVFKGMVKLMTTLKMGDSGREVKMMQHLLAIGGYLDERNGDSYSGLWDAGTDQAKERFDQDHGLHTPGDTSCGPKSWESLLTGRTW